MLTKKTEAALNKQINHELRAAYSYMAMEAWFEEQNLKGFAAWMKAQHAEEMAHARKIFDFVVDCGGKVELEPVPKPRMAFKSALEVFSTSVGLEKGNTAAIYALYALAVEEKDYATQSLLKWFIDEQVEEEDTVTEIESLLQLAGDNSSAILLLNEKYGARGGKN